MDAEQLTETLTSKLSTLEGRLNHIKRDITKPHSNDSGEQAQERENDEVLDAIGNETSATIRLVKSALLRLQDGSYGICTRCSENISEARLSILPETTTCIGCEGAREQNPL